MAKSPKNHNFHKDTCEHCGLENNKEIISKILDHPSYFCCFGCKAVFELIHKNGLQDFYKNRVMAEGVLFQKKSLEFLKSFKINISPELIDNKIYNEYLIYDEPIPQSKFIFSSAKNSNQNQKYALIEIAGMTCAACGWLNEKYLAKKNGVKSVNVNMATKQMLVEFDITKIKLSQILSSIKSLGYIPNSISADNQKAQIKAKRDLLWKIFIAGLGMMQAMSFSAPLYFASNDISLIEIQILRWTTLIIITPVLLFSAQDYFIGSIKDLANKRLSMEVPIALGLSLGYFHSAYNTFLGISDHIYLDSISMLLFFLLCAKFYELSTFQKVTNLLYGKLRDEIPTALRVNKNNDTHKEVDINKINSGDTILVKHGFKIPTDGRLITATAEIDESMLTGESLPIEKRKGEFLHAGSINCGDYFTYSADVAGGIRGRLRQEIELLVAKSLNQKPRFIKTALQIARYFIFTLLILTISTFAFWFLTSGIDKAIKVSIALLVVTCPCALALAAPLTLSSLMAELLKHGGIIQNASIIEKVNRLSRVILDKTGTITKGNLNIKKIFANNISGWNQEFALKVAAAIEQKSEHPIAKTFFRESTNFSLNDFEIIDCQRVAASGLEVIINSKYQNFSGKWRIGKKDFMKFSDSENNWLNSEIDFQEKGTRVYLAKIDDQVFCSIAVFILTDEIHDFVQENIHQWQNMGMKINILSGDQSNIVNSTAKQLTINSNDAYAGFSPSQKMDFIQDLQKQGEIIMVIGDGVNDAPILAQADISVGMPSSSDLSKISADIIILASNTPWQIIYKIIPLLKKARRLLLQNYCWAAMYNIAMIPIAILGWVNPWLAGLGMSLSSVVVLINSMRIFNTGDNSLI